MMTTDISQIDLDATYSYADYLNWNFKERIELIMGKIFKMSPAPAMKHQRIASRMASQMYDSFKNKPCEVFFAPFDVRLTIKDKKTNKDIQTVVQPDICVICDESKLDKRGCLGSPDLVIEILSPGNSKKEMKQKFQVYEASGVREYWLVEPKDCCVFIYTLNDEGKYIGHRPMTDDEIMFSHIFPEMKIDLAVIFEGMVEEEDND
jgi:Uma2 family endonuclease